jgi:hypothetical protein
VSSATINDATEATTRTARGRAGLIPSAAEAKELVDREGPTEGRVDVSSVPGS